jgi:hypothetical protein
MKKNLLLLLNLVLVGVTSFAQSTEIELIRTEFSLDKKEKVAAFLDLPDSVAKKFWPIYNQYEMERAPIVDRRIKMLEQYAGQYENLDNDLAAKLWKESAAIQRAESSLREKYTNLIRSKVSRIVALNFYMIEDFIATAVKLRLYNTIPPPQH